MATIRVMGRVDLAQQVHAALSAAGMQAEFLAGAPAAIASAPVAPGTIDVVFRTGVADATGPHPTPRMGTEVTRPRWMEPQTIP